MIHILHRQAESCIRLRPYTISHTRESRISAHDIMSSINHGFWYHQSLIEASNGPTITSRIIIDLGFTKLEHASSIKNHPLYW
jgi:hypothetical protein